MSKDPSPNWSRGITKDEHDALAAGRKRPLTDKHPGLRRDHPQPDEHPSLVDEYLAAHTRRMDNEE